MIKMPIQLKQDANSNEETYYSMDEVMQLTGITRPGIAWRINKINSNLAEGEKSIVKKRRGQRVYMRASDVDRLNAFEDVE
jgi:transcriptional antiterminator